MNLAVLESLSGKSSLSLSAYNTRVPGGTRRYYASEPRAWFEATGPGGSVVMIRSSFGGKDTHTSIFRVYGDPTWFSQRPSAAGAVAYMMSETAGNTPAETIDRFYLQLCGRTSGASVPSFEVKLMEDPPVCTLVPTSIGISASYVGEL